LGRKQAGKLAHPIERTEKKRHAHQPKMWKSQKDILGSVSSSSVVELKAQLAEAKRAKNSQPTPLEGSDKTVKKMAKNPGVEARNARDLAQTTDESVDGKLAASWVSLQRKAAIYDKMQAEDYDDSELLVDFVRKSTHKVDSVDELDKQDKDPWVEYTDEFGRSKVVRKSQVPAESIESQAASFGLRGQSFVKSSGINSAEAADTGEQVRDMHSRDWDREEERLRWEQQVQSETLHYDAKKDVRPLGTAFYRLSQDEEERAKQMEELNAIRQDTLVQRSMSESVKDARAKRLEEQRQRVLSKKRVRADDEQEQKQLQEKVARAKAETFLSRMQQELRKPDTH